MVAGQLYQKLIYIRWRTSRDSNPDEQFWRLSCCHYIRDTLFGSPGKARTSDIGINSAAQLPTVLPRNKMVEEDGIEPTSPFENRFTVCRTPPTVPFLHFIGALGETRTLSLRLLRPLCLPISPPGQYILKCTKGNAILLSQYVGCCLVHFNILLKNNCHCL